MLKIIAAVIFAAIIADVTVILPSATAMIETSTPQRGIKSDQLQIGPVRLACPQAAWPYYEAICVHSRDQRPAQPSEVRVIVDRLSSTLPGASVVN